MSYGIKLEVWGDFACFTRPEMKVERVSYDTMTPSAARNILQSIYWKPAIDWKIDKIHTLNEIRFMNIKRNEVPLIGSFNRDYIDITKDRQQRYSLILKDVRYVIEAHFEMTKYAGEEDTIEKHIAMANRRIESGQCFNQPYFGCREFSAYFRPLTIYEQIPKSFYDGEQKDMGFMLFDIDFLNNNDAIFYRAKMKNGVMDLRECEVMQ